MIGIYNYTVVLTYIGMIVGFTGITCILNGDLNGALICLMISGVCDMFDGKIAFTMERTKREKRFGIQIDSLSDLVCFGALPAAIIYSGCGKSDLSFLSAAFYLLCALIRLASFNVDEEERQEHENGKRSIYLGLPVTTAALIFPVLFGIGLKHNWPLHIAAPLSMLITAAFFLIPFRLQKPVITAKIRVWIFSAFGLLAAAVAFVKL